MPPGPVTPTTLPLRSLTVVIPFAPHPRPRVERGEDEERLEHDREVVPHGHRRRPAADQNRPDVQTFGGKKAKLLSDKKGQRAAECRRVRGEVDDLGGGAGARGRQTKNDRKGCREQRPAKDR